MSVCDGPRLRGPNKGKPARGTEAGRQRHYDVGETPCQACHDGAEDERRQRRDRKKGDKAGRRRDEWCRALEHRLTLENTYIQPNGHRLCRACKSAYARAMRRVTVFCAACERWFTEEAFEAHQVSPPGNPNAPLMCLDDETMTHRFYLAPTIGQDVNEYWRALPSSQANQ